MTNSILDCFLHLHFTTGAFFAWVALDMVADDFAEIHPTTGARLCDLRDKVGLWLRGDGSLKRFDLSAVQNQLSVASSRLMVGAFGDIAKAGACLARELSWPGLCARGVAIRKPPGFTLKSIEEWEMEWWKTCQQRLPFDQIEEMELEVGPLT